LVAQIFIFAGWDVPHEPSGVEETPTLIKLVESTLGITLAIGALIAIGHGRCDGGWRGWGLTRGRSSRILMLAVLSYVLTVPVCFALLKASNYLLELLGRPSGQHATITMLLDPSTPRAMRILAVVNA